MHRQTIKPMTTTRAMAGMAAAPMDWTANGHDAGDQDGAGQADDEGAPPVDAPLQRGGHLAGGPP